jgi:hypothetical protein
MSRLGFRNFFAFSGIPAWDPKSLPNMVLWLDATQITGLGDQAAVGSWADISGASNHAIQADATRQPKYLADGIGGKPAISFDGINDVLSGPQVFSGGDVSFFAVGRLRTRGSKNIGALFGTSNDSFVAYSNFEGNRWRLAAGGNTEDGPMTLGRAYQTTAIAAGSTSYVGLNNGDSSKSGVASGTRSGTYNLSYWRGGQYHAWDIGEIIVYNSNVSGPDRTNVQTYLMDKWSIDKEVAV